MKTDISIILLAIGLIFISVSNMGIKDDIREINQKLNFNKRYDKQ